MPSQTDDQNRFALALNQLEAFMPLDLNELEMDVEVESENQGGRSRGIVTSKRGKKPSPSAESDTAFRIRFNKLNHLKVGDQMRIRIRTKKTGFASVCNLGISGKMNWLCRNFMIHEPGEWWISPSSGGLCREKNNAANIVETGNGGMASEFSEKIIIIVTDSPIQENTFPENSERLEKFIHLLKGWPTDRWSWTAFESEVRSQAF